MLVFALMSKKKKLDNDLKLFDIYLQIYHLN